jgi:hypothetical protein
VRNGGTGAARISNDLPLVEAPPHPSTPRCERRSHGGAQSGCGTLREQQGSDRRGQSGRHRSALLTDLWLPGSIDSLWGSVSPGGGSRDDRPTHDREATIHDSTWSLRAGRGVGAPISSRRSRSDPGGKARGRSRPSHLESFPSLGLRTRHRDEDAPRLAGTAGEIVPPVDAERPPPHRGGGRRPRR